MILGTGDFGTRISEETAMRLMERFLELGGSEMDTAHIYASWASEEGTPERIVGRFLRENPGTPLRVATKGCHSTIGDVYPRPDVFLSEHWVRHDYRDSLDRLGVDAFDLWYYHRDDPRVPVEEIVEWAQEIPTNRLGVSNWSLARLEAANAYARSKGLKPFVAWQNQGAIVRPHWNMSGAPGEQRRYDGPAPEGVVRCPYSPAAVGWFAGRNRGDFDTPENVAIRARCEEIGARIGASPTQVALKVLIDAGDDPIVGTSRIESLEDAMGAYAFDLPADANFAYPAREEGE